MIPQPRVLPAPERPLDGEARTGPWPDTRRALQLGLAFLWLVDGLLQLQPSMFSRSFATDMLAPTAQGNPGWVADSITWAAGIVAGQPAWANAAFAALQLALGVGIAWQRTLRRALAASIAWVLLVWWFGEGLGGVLAPGASALGGAPGAAFLYAVLAVLVWPTAAARDGVSVAAARLGPRAAKTLWVALWAGLAALNLEPANLDPGSVHDLLDGKGGGQPGWLDALITASSAASENHGTLLSVLGALVLALVAAGMLLPPRLARAAVVLALASALFVWVLGEGLGTPFGGQATDPNSGPVLALVALAYWPRAPHPRPRPALTATVEAGE